MGETDAMDVTVSMIRVVTHFPIQTAAVVLSGYSPFLNMGLS